MHILKWEKAKNFYLSREIQLCIYKNHAMRDFRIFLEAQLNSLTRVDILLGTKIMSLAFIDPNIVLLGSPFMLV